jgi:hypothetical protein
VASTHLLGLKERREGRMYLFNVGVEKTQAANPVDGKATTPDFQKKSLLAGRQLRSLCPLDLANL